MVSQLPPSQFQSLYEVTGIVTIDESMVKFKGRLTFRPQKDNLSFCVWQDTKAVMVLSDYHDPTEKGSVKRRKQECNQIEVVVPTHLSDNQKHMKGVDVLEQMVGYYQFKHHSKKWWTRLFFLLAVGCYNAYIAARCAGGKTFTAK